MDQGNVERYLSIYLVSSLPPLYTVRQVIAQTKLVAVCWAIRERQRRSIGLWRYWLYWVMTAGACCLPPRTWLLGFLEEPPQTPRIVDGNSLGLASFAISLSLVVFSVSGYPSPSVGAARLLICPARSRTWIGSLEHPSLVIVD